MTTSPQKLTDAEFFRKHCPSASRDELFNFCERVAIMVIDGGVPEQQAREIALKQVNIDEY